MAVEQGIANGKRIHRRLISSAPDDRRRAEDEPLPERRSTRRGEPNNGSVLLHAIGNLSLMTILAASHHASPTPDRLMQPEEEGSGGQGEG